MKTFYVNVRFTFDYDFSAQADNRAQAKELIRKKALEKINCPAEEGHLIEGEYKLTYKKNHVEIAMGKAKLNKTTTEEVVSEGEEVDGL